MDSSVAAADLKLQQQLTDSATHQNSPSALHSLCSGARHSVPIAVQSRHTPLPVAGTKHMMPCEPWHKEPGAWLKQCRGLPWYQATSFRGATIEHVKTKTLVSTNNTIVTYHWKGNLMLNAMKQSALDYLHCNKCNGQKTPRK